MLTYTEENYIKAIYHLSTLESETNEVGTSSLAALLQVKPATVNDMLKKLREKGLVDYEKYGKITLQKGGKEKAISLVRKHRLWETFLVEKLDFSWDEVHAIAEELEHIHSDKLIEKLDAFLNYPKMDPHGDPIPTQSGEINNIQKQTLFEVKVGGQCKMVGVADDSAKFLQYADKLGLFIHQKIKVISRQEYDDLTVVQIDGKEHSLTKKFAENIFVV